MLEADPALVTLVIPLLNERESLAPLFAEIGEVAKGLDLRVEVIFVDDGSNDGSWDSIRANYAKGDSYEKVHKA